MNGMITTIIAHYVVNHGDVNGVDFWLDDDHCGKIVHRSGKAITLIDGSVVLTTENDWNIPDGERLLSDVRRYHFQVIGDRRVIDVDFLLVAADGDVNLVSPKLDIAITGNHHHSSVSNQKMVTSNIRVPPPRPNHFSCQQHFRRWYAIALPDR